MRLPVAFPEQAHGSGEDTIHHELNAILASDAFRSSRRCQDFLRHVVDRTLAGQEDSLKERTIAVDLLGRPAEYDSRNDSVVRVTATDVRRRLAQYYGQLDPSARAKLEIHLPTGSYVAQFLPLAPTFPKKTPQPSWRGVLAAVAVIASLGAAALWGPRASSSDLDLFWKPILDGSGPVLMCFSSRTVYSISSRYAAEVGLTAPTHPLEHGEAPRVRLPAQVPGDAFVPMVNQYVGIGSAVALSRVSSLLSLRSKEYLLQTGEEVSFDTIRAHTTVLVGAFNNAWTLRLKAHRRFAFARDGERGLIQDLRRPGVLYSLPAGVEPQSTTEDYAVIERHMAGDDSPGLVLLGGITQYGTRAAGELLSNAAVFSDVMKRSHADWRNKSFELLVHVRLIDHTPTKPEFVAIEIW